MPEIHEQPIREPSAWRGADVAKADFCRRVTAAERAALDAALAATARRDVERLTADDFSDPTLRNLADGMLSELRDGRGLVVLHGCDPACYSRDQLTKVYWGLGTLMGMPQTQSIFGDRLGHVRKEADNPTNRGYRSDRELFMHTDTTDIAGLLCLQSAKSGGVSQFASSMTIHNEIVATRPDLLPALYEGFNWHLGGEQNPGDPDITVERIPIYAKADGKVCCRYLRGLLDKAGAQMGGTPPVLTAAMDYMDAIARRGDIAVEFTLEPGEMVYFNNFTVLHARTAFEDHEEVARKRHLVRLWLEVPGLRPYPPAMDPYRGGGIKGQPSKLRSLQTSAV